MYRNQRDISHTFWMRFKSKQKLYGPFMTNARADSGSKKWGQDWDLRYDVLVKINSFDRFTLVQCLRCVLMLLSTWYLNAVVIYI